MNYLQKLIDASTKVYECYLEIIEAEYNRKEDSLNEEMDELIEELKSLVMHEDLCLEEFFLKTSDDEMDDDLSKLYSNEFNLDEDILIRVINKVGRRIENPADKEKTASEGAQKLIEQTKRNDELNSFISEHEGEIKNQLEDQLLAFEEEYELSTEMNLELQRKLAFFLEDEIKKESNPKIYRELIKIRLMNFYANPIVENEMIKAKFHVDSSSICVESFIVTDGITRIEYELSKVKHAGSIMADIISCLTQNNWDDSIDNYVYLRIINCSLRAVLYGIEDIHYEEFLELIKSDDVINNNEIAKNLFGEIIEVTRRDREKYPYIKFSEPFKKSQSIQMTQKVYSLYEKLADLEIRRYDGEDTDFEFQRVIDAIKLALPEENRIVYAEMQESIYEGKNGEMTLVMANDHSDSLVHDRIDDIINRNFPALMEAEYKKRGMTVAVQQREKNPLSNDIQKSYIFFIDEAIGNLPKETRDWLIRRKYYQIYGNPIFEEELLDNGCKVSREWLLLSFNFGMSDEEIKHYDMLNESNFTMEINGILDNLYEMDFYDDNMLDKDSIFVWYIAAFRSILYVASEAIYQKLKKSLEEISDQMILNEKHVYAQIINRAIEESIKDRETYPKLVL